MSGHSVDNFQMNFMSKSGPNVSTQHVTSEKVFLTTFNFDIWIYLGWWSLLRYKWLQMILTVKSAWPLIASDSLRWPLMTYDLDLYTRWVYKIPSNRVMLGPRFPLSRPEKRAFSNSELNLSSKTLWFIITGSLWKS